MFRPPDAALWHGRVDAEEGPHAIRWHQRVRALPAGPTEPGLALLGFACDADVVRNKGRAGAAAGPAAIRQSLANLAWHSSRPVFDAGDVVCVNDDLEAAQAELGRHVAALLASGHLPVVLGGGHGTAFGNWQGLAPEAAIQVSTPVIGVINFDAHFDLRSSPQASSGTPFRQIAEDCAARGWPFHYACLGIAECANTAALFGKARQLGAWWLTDDSLRLDRLAAVRAQLSHFVAQVDWIYMSLDLDVLPAAVAPGVSAPAARGVELAVIEALVDDLLASRKLRSADIVELNPAYDIDQRTARVAARLIWKLAR
ncbi:MAG TPA: formimidoylglutamase [Planctomycetota bacterium]|jgi:formiminoglutamase